MRPKTILMQNHGLIAIGSNDGGGRERLRDDGEDGPHPSSAPTPSAGPHTLTRSK